MKLKHFNSSILVHVTFLLLFSISVPKFTKDTKLKLDSAPVLAQAVSQSELDNAIKQIVNEEQKAAKAQEKTNKELAQLKAKKVAEEKSLAKIKKDLQAAKADQDKLKKQKELAKKELENEKSKLKAEQQKISEAKLKSKEQQQAQELAAKNQTKKEIDIYASMIQSLIRNNWVKAYGMPDGLDCQLEVTTGFNGEIEKIIIVKGSGNAAFDRSAEAAVLKSSPLPLPQDKAAKAEFRKFKFTFAPEIA